MTANKKYYAGVGSRATPKDIQERMANLAKILSRKGYILRSGGAEGADLAFESGASRKEIFYPNGDIPMWAQVFTEHFHPAPQHLKPFPRKLMSRNALQVLGRDGNTPVDFLVCWTKGGKDVGGTAQAIKIARWYGIPVYNFADERQVEFLRSLVKTL